MSLLNTVSVWVISMIRARLPFPRQMERRTKAGLSNSDNSMKRIIVKLRFDFFNGLRRPLQIHHIIE